jgi:hypothetical protein
MNFGIKSVKTCRKHTKFMLEVPVPMDESFFESFALFGKPEITNFSAYSPNSSDFYKLSALSFGFELTGPVGGSELKATFRKDDQETIEMVWSILNQWMETKGVIL